LKFWEIDDTQHRALINTLIALVIPYLFMMLLEGSLFFWEWTPQGRVLTLIGWVSIYYFVEVKPNL